MSSVDVAALERISEHENLVQITFSAAVLLIFQLSHYCYSSFFLQILAEEGEA